MLTAVAQIIRGNMSTWPKIHDMDRSKHGHIISWNLMLKNREARRNTFVHFARCLSHTAAKQCAPDRVKGWKKSRDVQQ